MNSKRLKFVRNRKKPILSRFEELEQQYSVHELPRKTILDPQGQFLQTWNNFVMLSCVASVALDPIFFYIPRMNDVDKCLDLDKKVAMYACVFRSLIDAFYAIHIIFQFRTGFIVPSSRGAELNDDPKAIAKRYLLSYFIIDLLSILPLPQVLVFIMPSMKTQAEKEIMLMSIIFSQSVPRLLRIYPLYIEVTRASGILEIVWFRAAYNLFLYMLASHVIGAFWYLFAIEREENCWQKKCREQKDCLLQNYYCGHNRNKTLDQHLYDACPFIDPDEITNSTVFNFGIFTDVLSSGVVESRYFWEKFFYCFWWGLRNLGSLGQNLNTSTFVWEILFAVAISIFGLVLFALLIGNFQRYLQSTTGRVEEMLVKRDRIRQLEQWMSRRSLPRKLRDRIRRCEEFTWKETGGVVEENLIRNLPKDLKRDIKRHLCLALLRRVPLFDKMDGQLLDALCDRLKPALYTEKSFIIREGDPVEEMLFIMRGNLATMTTYGGRTGFLNTADLKAGDFCGDELLTWALDPHSSTNLPISTRTVNALVEVEAFALMAEDLKFVATQFQGLHSPEVQHTFRFYSQQWRTWAACFIQTAWRRYREKKLGATIYASRFAANAL
ncbi:cyclic nucleotide-gated ion channel 1-like isoform X2 [Corylus avellana]|uniref:cyclic nucleotide-gated ion channel 1-like isoform X2 n=1 Tax=Corylus avellana TaxID=13451 RepID=UPI00286A1FDA|nr:cyclic nucleotide-gated ion channel 1-like isoform X2 [Corylus avellana]